MELTKLSTKGQIVIPEKIRKSYKVGSAFVVDKVKEMIVLKPVKDLTQKEKKNISNAWKEIDYGKASKYSQQEFFKEMKKW